MTNESEIFNLIQNKQNELQLYLFIANCCLVGIAKDKQPYIISRLANNITIKLGAKENIRELTRLCITEGLKKFNEEKFIDLLKQFIKNKAQKNLVNITENLIFIINEISSLEKSEYHLSTKKIGSFTFIKSSERKNETELIKYISGDRKTTTAGPNKSRLKLNEKWQEIFAWAQQQDNAAIRQAKANASRRDFKFLTRNFIPGTLLITFLLAIVVIFFRSSVNSLLRAGASLFSSPSAFFIFSAVVSLAAGMFSGAIKREKFEKQENESEIKKYEIETTNAEKEIQNELTRFFQIKIVEYRSTENKADEKKEQSVKNSSDFIPNSITVTPLLLGNQGEKLSYKPVPKPSKTSYQEKRVRFISPHIATMPAHEDEFIKNTAGILRIMTRGPYKTKLFLDEKVRSTIPNEFAQAFKHADFGETGTCIRILSNKTQAEVKVFGSDDRVFGVYDQEENCYRFGRFDKGLH